MKGLDEKRIKAFSVTNKGLDEPGKVEGVKLINVNF